MGNDIKKKEGNAIVPWGGVFNPPSPEAVIAAQLPDLAASLLRERERNQLEIQRTSLIYGTHMNASRDHVASAIEAIRSRRDDEDAIFLETAGTTEPEHSKMFPGFGTRVFSRFVTRVAFRKRRR